MSSRQVPSAITNGETITEREEHSGHRQFISEPQLFLLLAIIIGIISGLAVVCFQVAIDWLRILLLGPALIPHWPRIVIAPVAVGVVVAIMVLKLFPRVRGSGVNQTKAALYIYNGRIPFSTVIGKFITCSLAIGSGQSLGPEDPSLQIGAGIASAIGRALHLSRDRVRLIAPVGAAAGLAAAFNAPITAVLFVIEEVIGGWRVGVLGAVVLSAVSSSVVERWFMGGEPLFRIPSFQLVNPGELVAYAILGVAGGIASLIFIKLIAGLRPIFRGLPRWTQYLQPATAGLIIAIIGLRFPQVMGAGYEFMDHAMHDQYTWQILGMLAGMKILSTTLSFVSGTPGGMFAPTLFIGAMLGGAVGGVEHIFFPHLTGSVGAYALVGMGTMFAGFLRAPMTSVFMILEVSGNYSIILPVIISNTIAYLISHSLQPTPIFDLLSQQDGLDLPSMEQQRERRILRVEDAMRPALAPVLRCSDSVSDAIQKAESSNETIFLVADDLAGWHEVTKQELREWAAGDKASAPLRTVVHVSRLPRLHPDQALDYALREIGDLPLVPVVHRADFARLEGVISLADILAAYRRAGKATGDGSVE
ncbi:MAG TPA: chloride channel protein [Terriglobales bacterium]|nr:chloride channel protein [Terriglobales bacterium]